MFDDITPLIRSLAPDLRGRLAANEPMAPLTWFRVGGPAQVLFTPEDEADLAYLLSKLPSDMPVMPVGVGSNLIVRDGGVPGVVVRLRPRGFGEVSSRRHRHHRGRGGARQARGGSRRRRRPRRARVLFRHPRHHRRRAAS